MKNYTKAYILLLILVSMLMISCCKEKFEIKRATTKGESMNDAYAYWGSDHADDGCIVKFNYDGVEYVDFDFINLVTVKHTTSDNIYINAIIKLKSKILPQGDSIIKVTFRNVELSGELYNVSFDQSSDDVSVTFNTNHIYNDLQGYVKGNLMTYQYENKPVNTKTSPIIINNQFYKGTVELECDVAGRKLKMNIEFVPRR